MINVILWHSPNSKRNVGLLLVTVTKRCTTSAPQYSADHLIQQCCSILGVDSSCRDETVIRKAYLEKAKQYHPDSSFQQSNGDDVKFNQIQQAYEALIQSIRSNNARPDSATDDEHTKFDIRHTAPQHRTHLEYGGFGMGTPSQRQTAYYKMRAQKAQENVYEYRRDRASVETKEELVERKKRKDVRATNFIERLVEDLIQESMSRGEFSNIKSSGKPFHERNPHYMDFTTYKMNEILIDNGYIPEWIQLEKQIRESIEQARVNLKRAFKTVASESPSSNEQKTHLSTSVKWNRALDKFRAEIVEINIVINKLNLVVPMLWRQQMHYDAEKEIDKIIALDPLKLELPPSDEELSLIQQQELEKRHQEWIRNQAGERYSVIDALRDLFQSLRNFKV